MNETDDILDNELSDDGLNTSGYTCRKADYRQPPRGKLNCYDWLSDIPGGQADFNIVEVQFKNTRKGFYLNSLNLPLAIGDTVAVEAAPGHDIGQVTLTGQLVKLQMKKANLKPDFEIKRVLRIAKPTDLERFEEAKAKENDTMIRSRKIAEDLKLNMKIGDVEYQADGVKAIFYYIADERVDFRTLIRVLAETFKVRVEMRQIGARQEAGRIGGIGPCGRPLCCSQWMTKFNSVGTGAARIQDLSMSPQKLAGQCAKLKCCINFETAVYAEAQKQIPGKDIQLETKDNLYYLFKSDILARMVTYSTDRKIPANLVTISAERAFEIVALNKQGIKPDSLLTDDQRAEDEQKKVVDLAEQDDLTRFDKSRRRKKKGNNRQNAGRKDGNNGNQKKDDRQPNQKREGGQQPNQKREGGQNGQQNQNRHRQRQQQQKKQGDKKPQE